MIKYLGSKRRLVPQLGVLFGSSTGSVSGTSTALDLFTGTTRVAQEFCRRGAIVTAVDTASYSEVLAQCYVVADAALVDLTEVSDALTELAALPPRRGYVTENFCEQARYFHPDNGARIDAVREGIDELFAGHPLRPILLTSLLEAADAVDSTVGLQMAYLKHWAPRALRPLKLRVPELTPGTGTAVRGDAFDLVGTLPPVDVAYLDPPYNQHRYFTNYHVWETLVRWDAPVHYGVACKREDSRDDATKSVFNRKREMPDALAHIIKAVAADVVIVSFSDEGYVPLEDLIGMCQERGGAVEVLAFDSRRHVGAVIGIHSPSGAKVGQVSHTRNTEYVILAGPTERIAAMSAAVADATEVL